MPALCFRGTAGQGEAAQPAPFRKPPPGKHPLRSANGALAIPAPLPAPLPSRAKQPRPAAASPRGRVVLSERHQRLAAPLALTLAGLQSGRPPGTHRPTPLRLRPTDVLPLRRDLAKFATNRPGFYTSWLPASLYFYNLPLAGSSQYRQRAAGPRGVEAAGATSPTAAGWGKPAPTESGSLNSSGF